MRFECLLEWGSCNVRPKDRGVRGPAKLNRVHPASLHDLRARWPAVVSIRYSIKLGNANGRADPRGDWAVGPRGGARARARAALRSSHASADAPPAPARGPGG